MAHPPTIPDYDLLKRIGSGSYGDVWLARTVLGELRAVKIIYRNRFVDPRPFEREFEGIQRFEPISRSHPSQLAILHVGKNDAAGCFYYVMELADDAGVNPKPEIRNPKEGRDPKSEPGASSSTLRPSAFGLASDLGYRNSDFYIPHTLRHDLERQSRLPIPDCVQIGLSLATALAHLHEQGLVHRDIKPSNIIFVNGVAKLGDIGLVTEAGDTQSIVGTEGYLPPEGPGTPQADLYSLGKVLYEISTGMDRRRFAALPEDSWNWPDRDQLMEFNEIVLRACAKDPAQRYQTAEQLRADLALLQEGKSVRRLHRVERHWQSLRRFRTWSAVAVVILGIGIVASHRVDPPALHSSERRSTNALANDLYDVGVTLYLKGTPSDFAKAAEKFEAALVADPNFSLALAALAMSWSWDDVGTNHNFALLPRAKNIAEKALLLDDTLVQAHCSLGMHAMFVEWDWPKAEARFQAAFRYDPNNAEPRAFYGILLRTLGRTNEALREFEQAVELAPQSQVTTRFLGLGLFSARHYEEAVARCRKAAELADCGLDLWLLGQALSWAGEFDEAIDYFEKSSRVYGLSPEKAKMNATATREAFQREGATGFWKMRLKLGGSDDVVSSAGDHAAAGRTNEALDLLDRAFEEHHFYLPFDLKTHPQWDGLRNHPRFNELLKKLKLD